LGDRRDDLLGGVVQVIGGRDGQTRLVQDLLAQLDVRAFQTHDQRHLQAHFLHRGDDAFSDDVALHDAAEDVDQDAFDLGVGGDDLEGRCDLLLRGAAADVAEVGGFLAVQLDDVHRRHGQTGAVDHAADVAVQGDIGEVPLGGLDLLGVFFGLVAQGADVFVAVQGVAVERDLGVQNAQAPVLHDDQRVDLEHVHVLLDEGLVQDREQRLAVLGGVARQFQRGVDGGDVLGGYAGFRVDGDGVDLLGRGVGHFLDVHAASGRDDEGRLTDRAVDQQRAIQLTGDVGAVFDVQAVDLLAGLARLGGDQGVAQHFLGVGDGFLGREGQTHATLGVGAQFLELARAAAAGVDLRLHDIERARQLLGGGFGLVGRGDGDAVRNRGAVALEDLLGLI